MASLRPSRSQPELSGLILPTYISFQAVTATKSAYLSAYCHSPESISNLIQRTVHQLGGISIYQCTESDTLPRRVLIGAELPGFTSSDLWKIRTAVQMAGGIVETVRVNYQIRQPQSSFERPKPCVGCRYYYGKSHGKIQLVCAMHLYGPDNGTCKDWVAPDV